MHRMEHWVSGAIRDALDDTPNEAPNGLGDGA